MWDNGNKIFWCKISAHVPFILLGLIEFNKFYIYKDKAKRLLIETITTLKHLNSNYQSSSSLFFKRIFHNNSLFLALKSFYQMSSLGHGAPNQLDGPTLYWTTLDTMTNKESRCTMMDMRWRVTQKRILQRHIYLEMVGPLLAEPTQTKTIFMAVFRLMNWSILMLHSQRLMFNLSTTQYNLNSIQFVHLTLSSFFKLSNWRHLVEIKNEQM